MKYCAICGRYAEATHHLIFGNSSRKLADEDGLTIPICNHCHNMSTMSIHDHTSAEALSKMVGQLLWERADIINSVGEAYERDYAEFLDEYSRERFIKRYGRSFL